MFDKTSFYSQKQYIIYLFDGFGKGEYNSVMQKILEANKIKTMIKRQIVESFRELLSDPDLGLDLTAAAAKRIKKSVNSRRKGLYKPLDEIIKKYG